MLKSSSVNKPYTGWSTAYSVQSILLQLQAFLFDDVIPQKYGVINKNVNDLYEITDFVFSTIKDTRCTCGHSYQRNWPTLSGSIPTRRPIRNVPIRIDVNVE